MSALELLKPSSVHSLGIVQCSNPAVVLLPEEICDDPETLVEET